MAIGESKGNVSRICRQELTKQFLRMIWKDMISPVCLVVKNEVEWGGLRQKGKLLTKEGESVIKQNDK